MLTSFHTKSTKAVALPVNPILFRLLRIGKLARAIRMVTMSSAAWMEHNGLFLILF